MVEVFKTNVETCEQATDLLDAIHSAFINYRANFDLEDCDKILRVENNESYIESDCILHLLRQYGYAAEILPGHYTSTIEKFPILTGLY